MNGQNDYVPVGSPVEVGLLKLLIDRNIAVQDKLMEREREIPTEQCYKLMTKIPFSSDRKRMTVAYSLKDQPDRVRIVIKGAPEYIVPLCNSKLNEFAAPAGFAGNSHEGMQYLEDVIEKEIIMAGNEQMPEQDDEDNLTIMTGLKAITIAYRDMDRQQFE